jgi:hypothetical protein
VECGGKRAASMQKVERIGELFEKFEKLSG